MRFHDAARQSQSQTSSTIVTCAGAIELVEWLEYFIDTIIRNANTGIGHFNNNVVFPGNSFDFHFSPCRRKFDGVIQELFHDPGDFFIVGNDFGQLGRQAFS